MRDAVTVKKAAFRNTSSSLTCNSLAPRNKKKKSKERQREDTGKARERKETVEKVGGQAGGREGMGLRGMISST